MAAEVATSPLTGDWRADLAAIAGDVRDGLLRRPHLTVLLTSRSGRGAADLVLLDRTLGVLRAAGFDRRTAVLVNHALGNYVAGVALWEAVGLGGTTGEARAERRREAAEAVARLPADAFPNVTWVGAELVAGSAEDRFAFGLERLLDGVAAIRPRRRVRAARPATG